MEKYISYQEYMERGGTLPESDFNTIEYHAQKRLDYVTDCRISKMEQIPEEVIQALMVLIALYNRVSVDAQANNPFVDSYDTDGYSEGYGSIMEQISAIQQSADESVREMLHGVKDDNGMLLLYRGI